MALYAAYAAVPAPITRYGACFGSSASETNNANLAETGRKYCVIICQKYSF